MKIFFVILAAILCLFLVAGGVAAQEGNKDVGVPKIESLPKISAKNYVLDDFDRNLIRRIIEVHNKSLPIKEVIIMVGSSELAGKERKVMTAMVFGEQKGDYFKELVLVNGDDIASAISRVMISLLAGRNKVQATGKKRDADPPAVAGKIPLRVVDTDSPPAPAKEKSKSEFKIIKLKKK